MNDDLLRLVKTGVIEPAEAARKAIDKADIANKLRTAGYNIGSAA